MLRLENGRSLVFIYIRLLLDVADSNGHIIVDEACDSVIEQIGLDLDLDDSEVEPLVNYLHGARMLEKRGDNDYFLTQARKYVAFEDPPLSDSTERVRRFRIRQGIKNALPPYIEPIDPETDRDDYSCNYYLVLQRDDFRCAVCGGTNDISVYHIDGYPSRKKGGNTQNKLITLCGKCRNEAEDGKPIDDAMLKKNQVPWITELITGISFLKTNWRTQMWTCPQYSMDMSTVLTLISLRFEVTDRSVQLHL